MTTRKQIEEHLKNFYGDDYGNFLSSSKITHWEYNPITGKFN